MNPAPAPAATVSLQAIALPMSAGQHSDSRTVNSFLLSGQPLTLVDAGMPLPESLRALEAGLGTLGVRLADVEQLVITHTHPDHYGGAGAIVRAVQSAGRPLRVLAHPRAAAILADLPAWWRSAREYILEVLRRAGAPPAIAHPPDGHPDRSDWTRASRSPMADPALSVRVDVPLPDGAMIETSTAHWQAVHTPGHASTQLCLYDPEKGALLSSDHVLPDVTANMVLEPPTDGEPAPHPILDYLASLRRLQALKIERVWPGHGSEFGDAHAVLANRIDRCEQRLAQTAALLSDAPKTAWEVAEALYAGTPAAGSQRALFQVVAYLDALVAEGKAAIEPASEGRPYRYHAVTE